MIGMIERLTIDLKLYQIINRVNKSSILSILPLKNAKETSSMMLSAKVSS
jgi:hypothetical protein